MTQPSSDEAAPTARAGERRLALRAGIWWTFAGQGLYSAAQWGMVAALARLGNQAEVGRYALALALTAPLFLLLGLQLRSVQATDAAGRFSFAEYFSLRVLGLGLALGLSLLLAELYPQARWPIIWLGLAKSFEGISEIMYGLMQRCERLDLVARSVMGRGLLGLILLALLFAVSRNLALATAGVALAGLALLLAYDLPHARQLAPGVWWTRIPAALPALALPLGLVAGLISLGSAVPRLFIEHSLGSGWLGLYSALAYVTLVGSVIVVALGTALTTRLSHLFAAGDGAAFIHLTLRLTAAAAALGLGLVLLSILAGGPLLRRLYGTEYAGQVPLLVWLNVGGAIGYLASCAGFAVTAARRFRQQFPLFGVVTLALWLACWWLIPRHGLLGAAWAVLIAAAFQLAGSWLIVLRALREGPEKAP